MPEPELSLLLIRPLNRGGFRYIVTGSVAAIFYGEPRLTLDVDVVVFLNADDARRLGEFFPFADFYLPPLETIIAEIARAERGQFNIIHLGTGFRADVYLTGRDELNAWGFRFKRQEEFDGERIFLAPPEYVIVRKLEYYREGGSEKHLKDVRSMLAMSGERLDYASLEEWIKRRGLETEWQKVSSWP